MKRPGVECLSTERVIAGPGVSATEGRVAWAPGRSLWVGGMTVAALGLGPVFVTPGAVGVFLLLSAGTLCLGHSVGLHRLLIHRSLQAPRWLERVLAWLGTLVGMAGPLGMVRLHDMRDWAQRQAACHPLHAHRAGWVRDAWWQMHCRLVLARPPRFALEARLRDDPVLRWLERTWMLQQVPVGFVLFLLGGMPWLVWGVPVRVAVSVTGHWLVGHVTHRRPCADHWLVRLFVEGASMGKLNVVLIGVSLWMAAGSSQARADVIKTFDLTGTFAPTSQNQVLPLPTNSLDGSITVNVTTGVIQSQTVIPGVQNLSPVGPTIFPARFSQAYDANAQSYYVYINDAYSLGFIQIYFDVASLVNYNGGPLGSIATPTASGFSSMFRFAPGPFNVLLSGSATPESAAVPEPGSVGGVALGLTALVAYDLACRRKRRRAGVTAPEPAKAG